MKITSDKWMPDAINFPCWIRHISSLPNSKITDSCKAVVCLLYSKLDKSLFAKIRPTASFDTKLASEIGLFTHIPPFRVWRVYPNCCPHVWSFLDVKLWTNGFWGTLFLNNSTCLLFPVLLYWRLQSPCWTSPPAPIISFYIMVQYGSNTFSSKSPSIPSHVPLPSNDQTIQPLFCMISTWYSELYLHIRLCIYSEIHVSFHTSHGGFQKWWYPKMDQNGLFIMENPSINGW